MEEDSNDTMKLLVMVMHVLAKTTGKPIIITNQDIVEVMTLYPVGAYVDVAGNDDGDMMLIPGALDKNGKPIIDLMGMQVSGAIN